MGMVSRENDEEMNSAENLERVLGVKTKSRAQPIGTKILIKPKPKETQSEGGIIIPDAVMQRQMTGIVEAVPKETDKFKATVRKGDEVLFPISHGTILKFNGDEYFLIPENEIYFIIT